MKNMMLRAVLLIAAFALTVDAANTCTTISWTVEGSKALCASVKKKVCLTDGADADGNKVSSGTLPASVGEVVLSPDLCSLTGIACPLGSLMGATDAEMKIDPNYCNKGGKFCDFFAAPECNTDADCGAKAKKLKLPCCASFSKIAPCTLMGKATLSACADTNCIDVTPSLSGASSLSFGTAFPALVATLSTLALAVLA